MKRLTIALLGLVLVSSLVFAVTRAQFLNNQRNFYAAEVTALEAARDEILNDTGRIDKINTVMPLLDTLIVETLDAELRGDWIVMRDELQAEIDSWDLDLANYDAQITEAQDKVDEIDRLAAL